MAERHARAVPPPAPAAAPPSGRRSGRERDAAMTNRQAEGKGGGTSMAESALERLRTRLQAFNSSGDMNEILGDEVIREIGTLAAGPGIEYDMTAREIVAWLYWYRSQALPSGAGAAERESATKLFEIIYMADPEAGKGVVQAESV